MCTHAELGQPKTQKNFAHLNRIKAGLVLLLISNKNLIVSTCRQCD